MYVLQSALNFEIYKKKTPLQQNEYFWGYTGISLSVHVSVCVQNTSFYQSAGGMYGLLTLFQTSPDFMCLALRVF